MFSKFSLDQTDPISKLGAKVEPERNMMDEPAFREGYEWCIFEIRNHDIPEQKAVIGPKVEVLHWPALEIRPRAESYISVATDLHEAMLKNYESPRSAYWQEQMGETWEEKFSRLRRDYMRPGVRAVGPEWLAICEHFKTKPQEPTA